MSGNGEGEISTAEWVVILACLGIGVMFWVKPATATFDIYIDFVDNFPEPSQLGPNGSLASLIALVVGTTGVAAKQIRKYR